MKPHFILILVLVCFLSSSCKKDDPVINENKFGCKLVKLANEDGEYIEFKFQNDRITESLSFQKNGELYDKGILIYNEEGYIQRINFYKKGIVENEPDSYWNMKVDGQGRITEAELFSKRNSEYESGLLYIYEYNDKGQVHKVAGRDEGYQRNIYDSNGNNVQSYYYDTFNKAEYFAYETVFDTKFNPSNQNPLYQYLLLYGFFNVYSANNVLTAKSFRFDGSLSLKTTCSYVYNNQGYPVEVVRTDSSSSSVTTEKSIYTYECK